VGGEKEWLGIRCVARKCGDYVADVAADFFAGVVNENRSAKLFHFPLEAHGNGEFSPRQTVDLDQLDEKIFQAFLVDQGEVPRSLIAMEAQVRG
jgi:hypothetical protein